MTETLNIADQHERDVCRIAAKLEFESDDFGVSIRIEILVTTYVVRKDGHRDSRTHERSQRINCENWPRAIDRNAVRQDVSCGIRRIQQDGMADMVADWLEERGAFGLARKLYRGGLLKDVIDRDV